MDSLLLSYIDNNIIREYSHKTFYGLSLQINDVEEKDQENFLSLLFAHDPIARDLILDRAQQLIEERIPFVEAKENYSHGLYPIHDNQTGEVKWFPRKGAI